MDDTTAVLAAEELCEDIPMQTEITSDVVQTRRRQSVSKTDARSHVCESTGACAPRSEPALMGDTNGELSRNGRLTQWYDVWGTAMRRFLASRSSIQPTDLDDVAQEVFLRLLRYGDEAVVEHPQSYLFRIAMNVVNEWRERSRNCLPHDETWLADLQIEPDAEPESAVEHSLVSKKVRGAVSKLPPRQREVLLLHIRDDQTYKQIAHRLKLTPRIVRRDIARAYATLRGDLHAADLAGLLTSTRHRRDRDVRLSRTNPEVRVRQPFVANSGVE